MTSHQIIGIIVVLALIVLFSMYYILKHDSKAAHVTCCIVALVTLALVYVMKVENTANPYISATDKLLLAKTPLKVEGNLKRCGKKLPGMSDNVVFTITSAADNKPQVTECVRVSEKSARAAGLR